MALCAPLRAALCGYARLYVQPLRGSLRAALRDFAVSAALQYVALRVASARLCAPLCMRGGAVCGCVGRVRMGHLELL